MSSLKDDAMTTHLMDAISGGLARIGIQSIVRPRTTELNARVARIKFVHHIHPLDLNEFVEKTIVKRSFVNGDAVKGEPIGKIVLLIPPGFQISMWVPKAEDPATRPNARFASIVGLTLAATDELGASWNDLSIPPSKRLVPLWVFKTVFYNWYLRQTIVQYTGKFNDLYIPTLTHTDLATGIMQLLPLGPVLPPMTLIKVYPSAPADILELKRFTQAEKKYFAAFTDIVIHEVILDGEKKVSGDDDDVAMG